MQRALGLLPLLGSGTVLRDQCLAKYEARLRQEVFSLNVMPKASFLRGAGHGRMAQPDGIDDPPIVGDPASPSVHHQR